MQNLYFSLLFLQYTDPDTPSASRTLDILMSHTAKNKTYEDAWEELEQFVEGHQDWCRKNASYVAKKKNWKYDKFIKQFMYLALDPVGISIWARCFRKHVAICVNSTFWTTNIDKDIDKCDIVLLYRGYNMFEDTRVMLHEEYAFYADAIARTQAIVDEQALKKNVTDMKKRSGKRKSGHISSDDSDLDLEDFMDQEEPPLKQPCPPRRTTRSQSKLIEEQKQLDLDNVQKKDKPARAATKDKRKPKSKAPKNTDLPVRRQTRSVSKEIVNNVQKTSSEPITPTTKESETEDANEVEGNKRQTRSKSKEIGSNMQTENVGTEPIPPESKDNGNDENVTNIEKESEEEPIQTEETNQNENDSAVQTDSQRQTRSKTRNSENNMQKDRKAKPKTPKSKSDNNNVQKKRQSKQDNKDKTSGYGNKMRNKSVITAGKILQNIKWKKKGSWSAVTRSRKKEKVLATQYHCTKNGCDVVKSTKSAIIKHISQCDKGFRFKCRHCEKTYATLGGRDKHELYHNLNYRYVCNEVKNCRKGYMFLCEYTEHLKVHTGQNRWKCLFKGCGNTYAAKRTRDSHYRSHYQNQDVHCAEVLEDGSVCGQLCTSTNHLKQHMRGMHGEGWVSLCGKKYQWPGTMYSHQQGCNQCKALKAERNKAKNRFK